MLPVAVLVALVVAVVSTEPPRPTCSADTKFMVTTCAAELPDRICRGVVCWPFLHRQVVPCIDPSHALYERVRFLCPSKDVAMSKFMPTASSLPIATSASRLAVGEFPNAVNSTSVGTANTTFEEGSSYVRTPPAYPFDSPFGVAATASILVLNDSTLNATGAGQATTTADFVTTPAPQADNDSESDGETTVRSSPRTSQSIGISIGPLHAAAILAAVVHARV
ncbi:hypothetical protein H310_04363 [Aphanomyces invadans]|uniref:Uncharacterized protein n=1 Tax=Aphanomyces invadans TaxID=157072 RepID=A0A024UCN9_9STRA|nr:hypothetical protein H310_04363 [Aphanomyces invadans]ETW03955.1 hypothetical protein H310_04363 [Aphanomyces invadans]|eukprot:XP_008866911.1 hypothetical protein H310_04363 [Aphanomyces invadans]